MKKILITGENSYIGRSFTKWLNQWPEEYAVDAISVRGEEWKEKDFSIYDVVYHTAAIVHVKENDANRYFEVNRDLTIEIAKKSKVEGVRQFIFLSTMGVYGMETGYITETTKPNPKTPYAKSKLEAEGLLNEIKDDDFIVSIFRPPIIYGNGCEGNYPRLANMVLRLPIFPKLKNERSMIYIDNLSEFTRLVIDNNLEGLLFPQNREYVNTTVLAQLINKVHGKEIKITRLFNQLLKIGITTSETFGKVFGSLTYDKKMPGGPNELKYETCSFKVSIKNTEA